MLESTGLLGHARAEDKKLIKELTLEVLALKVPFRNLLSVSESSPVAGAIKGLNPFRSLDAGRARELQKAPSQPHNCSRFIVYSKTRKKVQALIDFFVEMFTGWVPMSALADMPAKRRRASFAPPGLVLIFFANTHQLALWAAFFRSFGAASFSVPNLKP